jgi:predicted dehydrogenase
METPATRRHFVKGLAATAAAFNFQVVPSRVFGANDRITLAGIGISGKGASDISGSAGAGFQVTHLCDVVNADKYPNLGGGWVKSRENYPDAKFFEDWREMLEAEGDKIDAVTVSTPDHVHAHAAAAAMRKNCAVYCQKPLTHGIWEARLLADLAAKTGVVTQMGNQAHANNHMRRVVELVRAGLIGDIVEVHAWTNRPIWPQGIPAWPKKEDAPAHVNWDLWIGPAPYRDYSPQIHPFKWRGYWDFGTGALGDMACHIMNMSHWAMDFAAPTSVSAVSADGRGAQSDLSPPTWATIEYQFAGKNGKGIKYMWYDGYKDAVFNPEKWALESNIDGGKIREPNTPPQEILEGMDSTEANGYDSLIVGSSGKIWFNRGKNTWFVKPGHLMDGFAYPEPTIPRAREENPHNEFYDAIKAGDPKLAQSRFEHSGPFTEMVLLGNLAVRLNKKVEWDSKTLSSPNCPEAAKLVKRDYREGWALEA